MLTILTFVEDIYKIQTINIQETIAFKRNLSLNDDVIVYINMTLN